jgi:Raf kinase inhibitor-like YbhB/YbcL family protein
MPFMEVQMIRISSIPLLFILLATLLAGCRSAPPPPTEATKSELTLPITSPAFGEGEIIPQQFTCDGSDLSPQLDWTSVPQGSQSLALIVDDPDAPIGTWVHWVLFDLPPDLVSLPEGASGTGTQGTNSFKKLTYGGPCPPKGSPHRYYFKLYALDTLMNLEEGASKAELENAMQGHILAQGQLMGKYGR